MNSTDMFLLDCPNYGSYLDSFSLPADRLYLRNRKVSHMLVTLGYRSNNAIYTQEQFESLKAIALEKLYPSQKIAILFSDHFTSSDPVLRELALREKPNVQNTISTIIFLKVRRKSGFEISGYIDYEESLKKANRRADKHIDWLGVFEGKVMLKPTPNDLSYYDWKTGRVKFNNSDNYIVVHDVNDGLLFMHRGDHKKICADVTKEKYSKNCSGTFCHSNVYGYVILYDHIVRKKI